MREIYTFWRQTIDSFHTTGAVAPSSGSLAKAITSMVVTQRKNGPVKVLEVGAGTGVVTERLFEVLAPEDKIDICEINDSFMACLQKRFAEEAKKFQGKARFLNMDIQKIEADEKYDFIVSSLPLNAFKPEMVRSILDIYLKILKPHGWISYFEYIGIRKVKMIVSSKEEKQRIHDVTEIVRHFIHENEVFHVPVWWNVPPAYVRHCQKK